MTEDSEPQPADQAQPAARDELTGADESNMVSRAQQSEPTEHPDGPTEHPDQEEDQSRPRRGHWWQRPTIRALKREEAQLHGATDRLDLLSNARTRLPFGESVHVGGLVMVEVFTPSTVSALYGALRSWPGKDERKRNERVARLDQSRSGAGGGWISFSLVSPPGGSAMGLPDSVRAVWLQLNFLMPSVAVVVATFTFRDDVADVSDLLHADYHTHVRDVRFQVYGRFGWLRARVPWSRPKSHGMSANLSGAEDQRQYAFEQVIREREMECGRWFFSRFPGRFARADSAARPVARLIFTEQEVPFGQGSDWFDPISLGSFATVYRSVEIPGWALKESQWPYARGRFILTVAARRRDAARELTKGESGDRNWDLTYRFGTEQAYLVAWYAIHALLALYSERLAKLRDGARIRRRPRRPVSSARELDDYLITDGLDAKTITSDVGVFTTDLSRFRRNVPEYTEDQDGLPDELKQTTPVEFVPALYSLLKKQATRLAHDTENTTGNIRGSAELRQAIANTRLQRTVLAVSLVAVIVAVAGIILAAQAG